jgi:hypothetical protein
METPTPYYQPNRIDYPLTFTVDYPDRPLNRLTTGLRFLWIIPIAIIGGLIVGTGYSGMHYMWNWVFASAGFLFLPVLLMILFCQKYPRWWFDWNLELQRFTNRVGAYVALMDDRYPSTTDEQSIHLDYDYPDAARDLNRWLPLVKIFMAIPHFIVIAFLDLAGLFAVIVAWFAILFTGRYPRGIFDFVEGVMRWNNRVIGYAVTLVTDQYPPFSLSA